MSQGSLSIFKIQKIFHQVQNITKLDKVLKYQDYIWKMKQECVKLGQRVKVEGQYKIIFVYLEYHYILSAQWQHGYKVVITCWLDLCVCEWAAAIVCVLLPCSKSMTHMVVYSVLI